MFTVGHFAASLTTSLTGTSQDFSKLLQPVRARSGHFNWTTCCPSIQAPGEIRFIDGCMSDFTQVGGDMHRFS